MEDRGVLGSLVDRAVIRIGALIILIWKWRASLWFRREHGRLPQLCPPAGFNDKVFWRKIVDRNPLFVVLNDKIAVRDWVRRQAPGLQLTRLLWTGADPEALPATLLGQPVMIKHNASSGFNIHYDGQAPRRDDMVATLKAWMARTYGTRLSEWAYGQVTPAILVEEMLGYDDGGAPDNINVHASRGAVLFASVYRGDKRGRREIGFFDDSGTRLAMQMMDEVDPLPQDWVPSETLFKALEGARALSRDVDYARCDFMATEADIWFNEMTTYTASGHLKLDNPALLDRLTVGWDLRQSWFLTTPQAGLREIYRKAMVRVMDRCQAVSQ